MMRAILTIAGVCVLLALWQRLDSAPQRQAEAQLDAWRTSWNEARAYGAEELDVTYVDPLTDWRITDFARTYCQRRTPRVEVNAPAAREYHWYAKHVVVPHELAHALTCVNGQWGKEDDHGPIWEGWVKALAQTTEQFEMIVNDQRQREERNP